MRWLAAFALAPTLVLALAACPGELQFTPVGEDGGAAPDARAADVATPCPDVPDLLARRCGSCHGAMTPTASLDLASPDVGARLLGVAATTSAPLADPAQPDRSVLYTRVTSTTAPMPPGAPLDGATTACILAWIGGLDK